MTWLRPVDRTSGTLTLSAGTLSCLAHHGTPLSKRCPTTTALERTIVPMDDADRMPPLGAVNPRRKLFGDIHRADAYSIRSWNGVYAACHGLVPDTAFNAKSRKRVGSRSPSFANSMMILATAIVSGSSRS